MRGGGLHSRVLHFYVLVFPINIQKCLVITRLGFIYMQSASVVIDCNGKRLFILMFRVHLTDIVNCLICIISIKKI